MYHWLSSCLVPILFLYANPAPTAIAWVRFCDVTEQSGIAFVHENGATGEHLIPETVGSGAAWFDYDRDGWLDLYLVNGGVYDRGGAPNVLYRNKGDGTFTDVTQEAGVGNAGFGIGVCIGDYDADDWPDIYVCNYHTNVLYHNNGDGTFTDVTERAGVGDPRWSASAAFFDMENDGDLDLYVANYLLYERERDGCEFRGLNVYCGPEHFDTVRHTLYRNEGDGRFTDVSENAGIAAHWGRGLGIVCGDYDNDGLTDIFVANDIDPNFLFHNLDGGRFEEIGFLTGIALSEDGTMGNSMGIDLADFDNDGGLDLIVTNFQDQVNTLYHNDLDGLFTDVTFATGTGIPGLPRLAWGCKLVDLDNDGWRDIFIANGHLHDNIELFSDVGSFAQPKLVFRGERGQVFSDMSEASGEAARIPQISRGAAFGDYDNDGDVDVVVNNLGGPATLFRNEGSNNSWIRVVVEPFVASIGARVWVVTTDGTQQMTEIHIGGSYASHSDTRVLFGLGEHTSATVWVRWPDGEESPHEEVSVGETRTYSR